MVGNLKPDLPPQIQRVETLESCPLCKSQWLLPAPVQPQTPFGLVQCGACAAVFLSPRPVAEAMPAYYDEYHAENKKSARQEHRAKRHYRRLARYKHKPGGLLEIGCGEGHFLHIARDHGWQVAGLELSQPRIERAKTMFGLDVIRGDVSTASFTPESFDAIAMFQLLEHLHDPRAVLQRAHTLLRPGGVLLISTPNVLAYARKKRGVDSWCIPRHLVFFSPRTIVQVLETLSFEVLNKSLRLHASLEEHLGWQPWPCNAFFSNITRNLWTPFGLRVIARKR